MERQVKRGKRIWVRPIRIEVRWDEYQNQHTIRIHLRWPSYRPPYWAQDRANGSCSSCGARPGFMHSHECEKYQFNLRQGH